MAEQTTIVVMSYDPLAPTRAKGTGSGFLDFSLIETDWGLFAQEVRNDLELATKEGWVSTELILGTTRIATDGSVAAVDEACLWFGATQLLAAIRTYFAENPQTSLQSVVLSVKDNATLETFLTQTVKNNVGRITFH